MRLAPMAIGGSYVRSLFVDRLVGIVEGEAELVELGLVELEHLGDGLIAVAVVVVGRVDALAHFVARRDVFLDLELSSFLRPWCVAPSPFAHADLLVVPRFGVTPRSVACAFRTPERFQVSPMAPGTDSPCAVGPERSRSGTVAPHPNADWGR